VLRVNPKGQVPVLVHGSLEIFDSTQIFEYLEDLQPTPALWPRDIVERARARYRASSQRLVVSSFSFADISSTWRRFLGIAKAHPLRLRYRSFWSGGIA